MTGINRQAILREKIGELPKQPGVYVFRGDDGTVLYVGKAKELRSRVASYFQPSADLQSSRGPMIAEMVEKVVDIDHIVCDSEVDALLTENRLIKDIQPPYNERLTDDKTFPYIEITREDFPTVGVTRTPNARSKLFGPFVNVRQLRAAVQELQRIFRFRTCHIDFSREEIRRRRFRPCLLHAIRQCSAPCAGHIDRAAYREDIKHLIQFLSGKRTVAMRQLNEEMRRAASKMEFELAARIRDQIAAMESLDLSGRPDIDIQPEVFFTDPREGLDKLTKLLDVETPIRIIEGFDIATIGGDESCGSLVCFLDGVPFKPGYKRFRIKTVMGVDDYAMMREVIYRRYRHVAQGEELFPDLILVDGGPGQLNAARESIAKLNLTPPKMISLAKREEEIFTDASNEPIRLARNHPSLKLLQCVRDEAHRFAQHYHHILRRKKTFGE